jgi:hypothetical protein
MNDFKKCMPKPPETFLDSVIPHFLAAQILSLFKIIWMQNTVPADFCVLPFFVVFI